MERIEWAAVLRGPLASRRTTWHRSPYPSPWRPCGAGGRGSASLSEWGASLHYSPRRLLHGGPQRREVVVTLIPERGRSDPVYAVISSFRKLLRACRPAPTIRPAPPGSGAAYHESPRLVGRRSAHRTSGASRG